MAFKWFKKHTADGLEVPDPTPIEIPLDMRPKTLAEQLRQIAHASDLREALSQRGIDTFDEADDFNLPSDTVEEFQSPYEEQFDPLGAGTRLDEIRGGMAEEMPEDRMEAAKERLKRKGPGLGKPSAPDPSPRGTGVPGAGDQPGSPK